jgi:hypothetical protein
MYKKQFPKLFIQKNKSLDQPKSLNFKVYFSFELYNNDIKSIQWNSGNIPNRCNILLTKRSCQIREQAKLIGKLLACNPVVPNVTLLTKRLELFRIIALKMHKSNHDAMITLDDCCKDINWWTLNIKNSQKSPSG